MTRWYVWCRGDEPLLLPDLEVIELAGGTVTCLGSCRRAALHEPSPEARAAVVPDESCLLALLTRQQVAPLLAQRTGSDP